MFDNIGGKIKILAILICVLGCIASLIYMCVLFTAEAYLIGFLVLAAGCLVSWIGSFFMYGFGELIENSAIIAETINKQNHENEKPKKPNFVDLPKKPHTFDLPKKPKTVDLPKKPKSIDLSESERCCPDYGTVDLPEGEWRCPDCGAMNKFSTDICEKCGKKIYNPLAK